MKLRIDGFTLLELLVVMTILGVLLTVTATQLKPPTARLFANSLRSQIMQAKFEAVKRNRPVSVLWDAQQQRFVTRVKSAITATDLPCNASDQAISQLSVTQYKEVTVSNIFTSSAGGTAIVWFPDARPRFCSSAGLPVANTSVKVSNSRSTLYVRVTRAGKVEVGDAPL